MLIAVMFHSDIKSWFFLGKIQPGSGRIGMRSRDSTLAQFLVLGLSMAGQSSWPLRHQIETHDRFKMRVCMWSLPNTFYSYYGRSTTIHHHHQQQQLVSRKRTDKALTSIWQKWSYLRFRAKISPKNIHLNSRVGAAVESPGMRVQMPRTLVQCNNFHPRNHFEEAHITESSSCWITKLNMKRTKQLQRRSG